MKQCPTCRRTFEGNLGFCQFDATPLVNVAPPPPPAPPTPPVVPPGHTAYGGPAPSGGRPSPLLLAGAAVALLAVVGGGVYLALSRSQSPPAIATADTSTASYDARQGSQASTELPPVPVNPPPTVDPPVEASDVRYADTPGDGFLALRSAPSVRQGYRLAQVPHGEAVAVLSTSGPDDVIEGRPGQWLQVRHGGTVGWAFSAFLRTASAPVSPPGAVPVGAWATVYEPKDGWLNLRSGPSTRTGIVTRMDNGERAYVRYCQPNVVRSPGGRPGRWCVVDYSGRAGWAFDAYLIGISR